MNSDSNKSMDNISAEEYLNVIISLSEEIFHDFKNTLATILGLSQLIALTPASEDAAENLEQIKKATLECRDQIDRFYSLVKGYNVDINRYEILSYIIFSTLDMIKYRLNKLGDRKTSIILSVNIHSMSKVYCNEYKMRQAILNILMNAIDAMEETGGVLEVNLFEGQDELILEIIDTGIGISKSNLKKIFSTNYTTKGVKGTGLGLKVSKAVFEEYGGRIEVKSEVGEGTTFTVHLPIETNQNN